MGAGDVTSALTIAEGQRARGIILAKSQLVLAGLDVAAETFRQCDPAAAFVTPSPRWRALSAGAAGR